MSLAKAVPEGIKDRECKSLPHKNVLLYPTCQKRIPSKKRFPFSKVTRVSRLPLG